MPWFFLRDSFEKGQGSNDKINTPSIYTFNNTFLKFTHLLFNKTLFIKNKNIFVLIQLKMIFECKLF